MPYEPLCETCDENGITALATEERHGVALCGSCATSQDEAAYERSLERYYGGDVMSIAERCAVELKQKQDLRRRD